jgi:periplasmic divalent cation tolerance protein
MKSTPRKADQRKPGPVLKRCSGQFRLVLVTAPSLDCARSLARAALGQRLVACANLTPGLESHYWWQNEIESASEVLILFKTRSQLLAKLHRLILQEHPYDTPEFIVVPVAAASARYLAWWRHETMKPGHRK